jgi:hypothetical protein
MNLFVRKIQRKKNVPRRKVKRKNLKLFQRRQKVMKIPMMAMEKPRVKKFKF